MLSSTTVSNATLPHRMLVIQMARTSDLMQSLMALRAAKQLYPGLKITLVARERFAAAAKKVPWIEQVVEFPSEELLSPALQGRKSEHQTLNEIASWATPLLAQPWDFCFNWTYSEASSFLAALIPSRVKLGFTRRADMTLSAVDGWSHFIQGIVQGGLQQNIHLTDILTTQLLTALQLHIGDPVEAGDMPVTSKGFFRLESNLQRLGVHPREFSRKWIGLQLGAGSLDKTWDPLNWAELATYILDRHPDTQIVLLGGPEDAGRAERFLEHIDGLVEDSRILNMIGKTDFDSWAALIGRCQWVIAGDTAAVHLASILGTRVLNLSLATYRSAETGPYGNGHYVLSASANCPACRRNEGAHTCKDAISAEAAYAAWSYAAHEWSHRRATSVESHFQGLGFSTELAGIQLSRSRIRPTDQGGGVVYEPLISRPMEMDEWLSQVNGHLARYWYCGWTPTIGQEVERERLSPRLIRELRDLDEAALVLNKVCEEARRTALQIEGLSGKLKSDRLMPVGLREELQSLGRKLQELENLVDRLSNAQLPLKGFSQMAKVLLHNLKGDALKDLGRESALSYGQLAHGVQVLRDWISHSLNLSRPRILVMKPAPVEQAPLEQ